MDCEEYNRELWGWQEEEYYLHKDSRSDMSRCLWDEVNNGEDDLLHMLGEHTPIKDCSDFGYLVSEIGDKVNNGIEELSEPSQLKRRRMLQFNFDDPDVTTSERVFVKSKMREDLSLTDEQAENEHVPLVAGFLDGQNVLDQSSENWLASCFNESEVQFSTDEVNACGFSDDHAENSERDDFNLATEKERVAVSTPISTTPCSRFKGNSSYIRTPTKMISAVAYPFALIKPCGGQGDLTLKDINQRIHDPGLYKANQSKNGDAPYCYSAFSGKPVVVKTKIRTEGGKGSITIMRTKG